MYKILFSITVHESIIFLEEQVKNILYYNKDSAILIHISKQYILSEYDNNLLDKLKKNFPIFINPISIETVYYKIATPQIANILYAKNINYEYLCMHASNEMYFREGAYDYMCQFDIGLYYIPSDINSLNQPHHRDIVAFSYFLNKPLKTYTGQHEGSFFKKYIIENTADIILKFCPFENLNFINDTTEETLFSTAIYNTYSNIKHGYPLTFLRGMGDNITENDITKTINLIETIRKTSKFEGKYVIQEPIVSIYAIKRVSRTNPNDELRKYLQIS